MNSAAETTPTFVRAPWPRDWRFPEKLLRLDTPAVAISSLCVEDVSNRRNPMLAPAHRNPGQAIVIGPVARVDFDSYVLCWTRFAPATEKGARGRVSMLAVPVLDGWTPEQWRLGMINEARRTHPGSKLPLHFWQLKVADQLEAVPLHLLSAFGADGESWASACDWWCSTGADAAIKPVRDKEL